MHPTPITDESFRSACELVRRRLLAAGESHHHAEDIAQTATLEAHRRRATLRDPESLPSFIWTIAKRMAWRGWNDRTEALTDPDDDAIAHEPDPADLEAMVINRHDVDLVLTMLPLRDRELLWAHHAEGAPLDVLAAQHSLAPSSMPRMLARARANYRSAASEDVSLPVAVR